MAVATVGLLFFASQSAQALFSTPRQISDNLYNARNTTNLVEIFSENTINPIVILFVSLLYIINFRKGCTTT